MKLSPRNHTSYSIFGWNQLYIYWGLKTFLIRGQCRECSRLGGPCPCWAAPNLSNVWFPNYIRFQSLASLGTRKVMMKAVPFKPQPSVQTRKQPRYELQMGLFARADSPMTKRDWSLTGAIVCLDFLSPSYIFENQTLLRLGTAQQGQSPPSREHSRHCPRMRKVFKPQ